MTRSRQSRPLCSPPHTAPGYGALKCHQLTSAKVVFINVIQPLWIAVTTTEEPGDMWYAAAKAILCVSPQRCRFDSSRRKRDTMEASDLQRCSERTGNPGPWPRYRVKENLPSCLCYKFNASDFCTFVLSLTQNRPDGTLNWDITKKKNWDYIRFRKCE